MSAHHSREQHTSLIRLAYILLYSVWLTGYYSARSILIGIFFKGKTRHQKATQGLRKWAKALLHTINVNYTIHNPFHFEPNKKYIVMCNHNSLYDIPLSFIAINGTLRMIAKKELSNVPVLGRAMKMIDFIFIDRKNRNQAVKDLEEAKRKMQEGIIIWICPEGHRSKDGKLLPLKQGGFIMALQTGAIIVPMGIRGTHQLLKPHSLRVKLNQRIDIYFGKPIDATEYTMETRQQLIHTVEKELKLAAGLE